MDPSTMGELVELMQPAAVELVGDDAPIGPDVVIDSRLATPGAVFVGFKEVHGARAVMAAAPARDALGAVGIGWVMKRRKRHGR